MNNLNIKKYIAMLILGFILIALDVHVYTPLNYPNNYVNSNQVIGEFQYYTLSSTYGASCTYKLVDTDNSDDTKNNTTGTSTSSSQTLKVIDKVFFKNIRIDIFNDFAGFLLIGIICFKLKFVSRRFSIAALSSFCGLVLNAAMASLPFAFNGLFLCNMTLIIGILYLACCLVTVFLVVSGLLSMCRDVCCRDERKWCKTCWFVSFILQILVTFIFWLGSDFKMLYNLGVICEIFLLLDIILFWIILHRTYSYIQTSYESAISKK